MRRCIGKAWNSRTLYWVVISKLARRLYQRDSDYAKDRPVLVGNFDAGAPWLLQLGHDLTGEPECLRAGRCHVRQFCTLLILLKQVSIPEVEVVFRHHDRGSDASWWPGEVPVQLITDLCLSRDAS